MTSINMVLERVERASPDAFDDETKAAWLLELEGQLYRETILRHRLTEGRWKRGPLAGVCPVCGGLGLDEEGNRREGPEGETEGAALAYDPVMDHSSCPVCGWSELPEIPVVFPEDGDKPLLAAAPYDRLYDLYVMAQADFYNREYDSYNNSAQAFNAALDTWRKQYHRRHMPI